MIYGSLCVSDVPKELFKKVVCKDGREKIFLNLKICKRKEVSQYGHTHFISVEPIDKAERKEGVNYIVGDLKEYVPKNGSPSPEDIAQAKSAKDDDLPFDFGGVTA